MSKRKVTKTGSSVLGIQRIINKDYGLLFKDYKKLSRELWRIPATKYILSGVAIAYLSPVILKVLKNNPQIGNFFRRKADVIENNVAGIGDIINDKIADLRSGSLDVDENAHH